MSESLLLDQIYENHTRLRLSRAAGVSEQVSEQVDNSAKSHLPFRDAWSRKKLHTKNIGEPRQL